MRTRIKVCGITRLDDALCAAGAGRRRAGLRVLAGQPAAACRRARRRRIAAALPPFVATVGVFVNQPLDEIRAIAAEVGLGAVQLHGDEPAAMWTRVPRPVHQGRRRRTRRSTPRRAGGLAAVGLAAARCARSRRGAAARAARSTGTSRRGAARDAPDRPGRRTRRRRTSARRSRGCARSRSTCRRVSSARPASRTPIAFARSSKASPRPTPHEVP